MSGSLSTSESAWDPWRPIPEFFNLGTALTRGQVDKGLGGKVALLWENAAGSERSFTYSQLDALSSRFASALARLGVQRGERVFLRLPNRPEFYIAALGVARLGGVFIPSSTQFRDAEVRYRLNDSGAVAVVTTARLADVFDRIRADCPAFRHLIVIDEDGGSVPANQLDFTHLIGAGSESFTPAPTRSDDIAFLAYTSGTTGDPKGVVHLQRYPIAYESLVRWWHDYRPEDVVACPAEVGWMLPVACTFLYALAHGLTVVLYDSQGSRFDADRWFALFGKYRITNFTGTPTIYRMLLTDPALAKQHDLSSWRHGVSAGEPLPADTFETIRRHCGISVLDGIGMSECMVYCFNRAHAAVEPGSCGRPAPGAVIELMDESMHSVPACSEGVLCVRRDSHPGMMKEYWNKPESTAQIFRGDWYWSGDVLSRDEAGRFWFRGRADDVIKASGYRISPFEVESCLVSHPDVLEAAAIESPDALRGQIVKAFVVLRPGCQPGDQVLTELQRFCKERMAGYKCPRRIEFVAALPKTPSGKVKRGELRRQE
jgi:acyl-coenzyme A synthetase/AMP-(fatty) acid ligase